MYMNVDRFLKIKKGHKSVHTLYIREVTKERKSGTALLIKFQFSPLDVVVITTNIWL